MNEARVLVLGGGLAGIAAALACADAGLDTVLLERREQLGGATYSIRRGGRWIDNGQHVFLRCCTEYRGLLRRIGAEQLTVMQRRLEIPLVLPGGGVRRLRRASWPAPLHLAPVLRGLPWLSLRERAGAASAALALGSVEPADPWADERTLGEWLTARGQSTGGLWELVMRPTLNLQPADASLAMAAMVIRTGLLERADAGDIGWATAPLAEVHGGHAERALSQAGVRVVTATRTIAVRPADTGFVADTTAGEYRADLAISCLPPREAIRVLPAGTVDDGLASILGGSPIVNLHVAYDRPVTALPFAAAARGPVQWVFDRTASSGGEYGQCLAVSLSAADAFVDMPVSRLRDMFVPALADLFPRARSAEVEDFFVTRDPRATFRATPGTWRARPAQRTAIRGLYLAGAWTSTGWPDTMEGAVRSGRRAAAALRAEAGAAGSRPPAQSEVVTL